MPPVTGWGGPGPSLTARPALSPYSTGLAGNAITSTSSSGPPGVNTNLAAAQQQSSNYQTADFNKALNNNNVSTPWGNITYQQTGTDPTTGAPIWSTNVGLNSNLQNTLNSQQGNNSNVNANAGGSLVNQINQNAKTGLGVSMGDPAIQQAIQSQYNAQTGLLQPTFGIQKEQLDTQLANQGLQPGSDAYNNAKTLQAQTQDNAYSQIANNAEQTGLAQQQQMFGQQVTANNNPLNQYLALQNGTQVQNPAFPMQNTSTANGTNVLGAQQLAYGAGLNQSNSQIASNNSLINGIFGLGQAGATLYGLLQ